MKKLFPFLISASFLLFTACEKDDTIYIEGNQAPPDKTIENITKENYINKLYISILGRQATNSEFDTGLLIINKNNLSLANREELVDSVLTDEAYFHNEYRIIRNDVINGVDTSEITLQISIIEQTIAGTNDQDYINLLSYYLAKLYLMEDIIPDLTSENINFINVQKRCVFNHFYDDINMGTENFVVSMFQNFFLRYPTTAELETGSDMVDGIQTILFFKIGQTKEDFIDHLLANNEYFEGQIRLTYLRFLFREPTAEEIALIATLYKNDLNFKAMQKRILTTDEYVGL